MVCAPIMEFVIIHWVLAFVILDMKEKLVKVCIRLVVLGMAPVHFTGLVMIPLAHAYAMMDLMVTLVRVCVNYSLFYNEIKTRFVSPFIILNYIFSRYQSLSQ